MVPGTRTKMQAYVGSREKKKYFLLVGSMKDLLTINIEHSKWFEPRSISSSYSVIIRVNSANE